MGNIYSGYTFSGTEQVTAAKLAALVNDGSLGHIVAADIDDGVITDTQMESVAGNKLISLNLTPSGAGVIPAANLTSVAQKGANSDITSLSGLTTPLSTAQGGTGSSVVANGAGGVVIPTGAVNTANGAVILNASSQLPAVSGALLTGITPVYTAGNYMVCIASVSRSTGSQTYVKIKEIKIGGSGTIRTIFRIKASPADTAYGQIYRNGGAVGTEQTTEETSYQTKTEDIAGWSVGDLLQLYIKASDVVATTSTDFLGLGVATPTFESGILVDYD